MVSHFFIHEAPIQVLPTLAQEIGLHESIVLQQIHYWLRTEFSRRCFGNHYWVRYIPQHWKRQFAFWDEQTLKRAIRRLERLEVLVGKAQGSDKVKYYRIDYATLERMISVVTWRPEGLILTQLGNHSPLLPSPSLEGQGGHTR